LHTLERPVTIQEFKIPL